MEASSNPRPWLRWGLASLGVVLIAVALFRWGSGRGNPSDAGQRSANLGGTAAPDSVSLTSGGHLVSSPASGTGDTALPSSHIPTPATSPLSTDLQTRQQLMGVWTHLANGQQWIENRPDGTARMFLQLDFLASLLYGGDIHLNLKWEVKNGVLTHQIISGTPSENVQKLVRDFGWTRTYRILETGDGYMKLESVGSVPEREDWTRSASPPVWTENPSHSPSTTPQ